MAFSAITGDWKKGCSTGTRVQSAAAQHFPPGELAARWSADAPAPSVSLYYSEKIFRSIWGETFILFLDL